MYKKHFAPVSEGKWMTDEVALKPFFGWQNRALRVGCSFLSHLSFYAGFFQGQFLHCSISYYGPLNDKSSANRIGQKRAVEDQSLYYLAHMTTGIFAVTVFNWTKLTLYGKGKIPLQSLVGRKLLNCTKRRVKKRQKILGAEIPFLARNYFGAE